MYQDINRKIFFRSYQGVTLYSEKLIYRSMCDKDLWKKDNFVNVPRNAKRYLNMIKRKTRALVECLPHIGCTYFFLRWVRLVLYMILYSRHIVGLLFIFSFFFCISDRAIRVESLTHSPHPPKDCERLLMSFDWPSTHQLSFERLIGFWITHQESGTQLKPPHLP